MNNEKIVTASLSETTSLSSRIEILPVKEIITTNDGRAFKLTNPSAVVINSKKEGIDMLVDYEHDSLKSEGSMRGVAAGWIKKLSLTESAIIADVSWTATARDKIQQGEFRYISPTLRTTKDGTIVSIRNVALTNEPALPLEAKLSHQHNNNSLSATNIDTSLSTPTGNELITALKKEYNLESVDQDEIESALSRAARAVEDDVNEARRKYIFPRAMENELTLMRRSFGPEKFKLMTEKLSNCGVGFAHLHHRQTDGIKFLHKSFDDQRTQEEKLACKLTGTTKEEFLKVKDRD
ncbi:phage protease [Vibrio quintilis]|uniref:Mu-like prophage I protein n=1 Tax=Vibrio quintilis TaxID=1117707 RepID=A0A1M7YU51_9VIBR|nr:phage protease [Vibrio quintilis]SHO56071.1 Mu-like prophage I protein [Vibrio quintilis]